MGRIIIFTGKGGVGKSSVASAHALKASREGKKTLIISTDMAHNLSDIFMKDISEEPIEISENLWAIEVDPNHEMQNSYGHIMESFKNMITFKNEKDGEMLEDIVVFPGMEELFSLLKIKELYEQNIFDLIIVDCAPTGETLSLLKFPELFSWYMEKMLPIGKVALKVLRPISKLTYKIDMPDNEAVNDIEKLYIKLLELQKMLKDREVCSIRLVTIPEKMVVEETKRSYMYLNLYNFNVDGIYVNRLIPKEIKNHFYDDWKKLQKKYYDELCEVFTNIPTYNIKWYEVDINGIEGLERVIADSLQDQKIFEVLKTSANETFEKTDNGYKLEIYVPFTEKSDFDLYESGTDIIIKIGNFKRNIPMPNVIRKYSIAGAQFNDGVLSINFE
jgi:arsenite/tail-anchored protein-transporting ATPase